VRKLFLDIAQMAIDCNRQATGGHLQAFAPALAFDFPVLRMRPPSQPSAPIGTSVAAANKTGMVRLRSTDHPFYGL
jgi:hypothetical protein